MYTLVALCVLIFFSFFSVFPNRHGGTNVQQALTAAVELKQPVYGYPVSSLSTMRSVGTGAGGQANRDIAVLRDCVPLKPGTTVFQFFEILRNYPYKLLSGEFVRAEVGCTSFDIYMFVC